MCIKVFFVIACILYGTNFSADLYDDSYYGSDIAYDYGWDV